MTTKEQILQILQNRKTDIIFLQETHCNPTIAQI